MYKFKITISYDGTRYGGWQVQPNAISIQASVQNVLQTVLRAPISVTGSGRTDAGVHALGQVAHFTILFLPDSLQKLLYSLNCILPEDIRIVSIEAVDAHFHARYSAKAKIYHYYLHTDRYIDPFKRLYRTHIRHKIDPEKLRSALNLFVGTHDFTSFANQATEGSAAKNPIKTITRIDLKEEPGGYRIEFEGEGFLYKMVRNLVGAALEVASGKMSLEEIPLLFSAKDRRLAPKTAPPQGLFLYKVMYF